MVSLWKNITKSIFETIIFYLIEISLLPAHHLWILAVLGSLGSNGWYQPIILTYMILFIKLGSQNNHYPYNLHRGLWQPSFMINWRLKILYLKNENDKNVMKFQSEHISSIIIPLLPGWIKFGKWSYYVFQKLFKKFFNKFKS